MRNAVRFGAGSSRKTGRKLAPGGKTKPVSKPDELKRCVSPNTAAVREPLLSKLVSLKNEIENAALDLNIVRLATLSTAHVEPEDLARPIGALAIRLHDAGDALQVVIRDLRKGAAT